MSLGSILSSMFGSNDPQLSGLAAAMNQTPQPDFFSRIGNNFSKNMDAAGPQGLAALGAAIASAPRNQWGAGLAQGLAGFSDLAQKNKKKMALSEALKSAMGDEFNPKQKAFFGALGPDNVEDAIPIVAKKLFSDKEASGPFAGTGFDASAANILVRGTLDPSVRSSPEYAIAYANATSPKVVTDAEGRQMLYTPPVPQGILPPMTGGQGQSAPQTGGAPSMLRPSMSPSAPPMPQPPSGPPPAAAEMLPDGAPETAQPSARVTAVPGGVTTIPGTGKAPTEAQFKASDYYTRMSGAEQVVSDTKKQADYMDWSNGVVRESGVGFLQGGNAQTYETAGDEWIAALLRKDSGAQVPPQELASLRRIYIPQWGDKPERLAYKAAARKRAAEAIRTGLTPDQIVKSEKVLSENPSPSEAPKAPPKFGGIVERGGKKYRFLGGDPSQQKNWTELK